MSMARDMLGRMRSSADERNGKLFAVLISLVLVVLAASAALVLVQGIDRQLGDVEKTYEVRNQARELTIALSEAESSQRGFVLTADDSFLGPYQWASAAINTRLHSLADITQGDIEQSQRVRAITGDIHTKLDEMAETVKLVQNDRSAEARRLIASGMGEQLMADVRSTLERFVAEENQKLSDRNQSIETSRRWLVGAIIVALAGAAMLGYALFTRTERQVSDLARSQRSLRIANEELEERVADRTRALDEARAHAEHERERVEALLRDTNHRIGNSLATVSSLLGLQLIRTESEEVRVALEAARARVHAIASAHRRLRLGDDLETASADEFLGAVLDDIQLTLTGTQARLESEIEPIVIGARDATTVGILVGELVTNALKHAFPDGRPGLVEVDLSRDAAGIPTLRVEDDGVGLGDASEPVNSGLGSVIIKQLSNQFGGTPHYGRSETGGVRVVIPLPGIEASLPAA